MAKRIKLKGGIPGKMFAIVDDRDYPELKSMGEWHLRDDGKKTPYYRAVIHAKSQTIFMHHVVMPKPKKGFVTEHENNISLDNRIENLRYATPLQNSLNNSPSRNRKIPYKGVYAQGNKFIAKLKTDEGIKTQGPFDTQEKAAKAYDKLSQKYNGKFGYLNFRKGPHIMPTKRKATKKISKKPTKARNAELQANFKAGATYTGTRNEVANHRIIKSTDKEWASLNKVLETLQRKVKYDFMNMLVKDYLKIEGKTVKQLKVIVAAFNRKHKKIKLDVRGERLPDGSFTNLHIMRVA